MSDRNRAQGGPRMVRPFDVSSECDVIVTLPKGTLTLRPYGVKGTSVIFFQAVGASKRLKDAVGTFCTSVTKGVDLRVTPASGSGKSTVVGQVDHIAIEKPAKAGEKEKATAS